MIPLSRWSPGVYCKQKSLSPQQLVPVHIDANGSHLERVLHRCQGQVTTLMICGIRLPIKPSLCPLTMIINNHWATHNWTRTQSSWNADAQLSFHLSSSPSLIFCLATCYLVTTQNQPYPNCMWSNVFLLYKEYNMHKLIFIAVELWWVRHNL